jgi:hypothetical protein
MVQIQPVDKYVITHPKDEQGNEIKRRFILTSSKPIKDKDMYGKVMLLLGETVPGIDGFNIMGRYTMEIVIAMTFEPNEVIAALKSELDIILSPLALPSKELIRS